MDTREDAIMDEEMIYESTSNANSNRSENQVEMNDFQVDADNAHLAETTEVTAKNFMSNDVDMRETSATMLNSGDGVKVTLTTTGPDLATTSKSKVRMRKRKSNVDFVGRLVLPRSSKTKAYETMKYIVKGIQPKDSALRSIKRHKRARIVRRRKSKRVMMSRVKNKKSSRDVAAKKISAVSARASGVSITTMSTTATSDTCHSDTCSHCGHSICAVHG